jgi:hypothetical protein
MTMRAPKRANEVTKRSPETNMERHLDDGMATERVFRRSANEWVAADRRKHTSPADPNGQGCSTSAGTERDVLDERRRETATDGSRRRRRFSETARTPNLTV